MLVCLILAIFLTSEYRSLWRGILGGKAYMIVLNVFLVSRLLVLEKFWVIELFEN